MKKAALAIFRLASAAALLATLLMPVPSAAWPASENAILVLKSSLSEYIFP